MWPDWTLRWIILWYNLAAQAAWREHAFQAGIHGVQLGEEPEWDLRAALGLGAASCSDDDPEYQAWRERRRRAKERTQDDGQ